MIWLNKLKEYLLPKDKDEVQVNLVFNNHFTSVWKTISSKVPKTESNKQVIDSIKQNYNKNYVSIITIYRNNKQIYDHCDLNV